MAYCKVIIASLSFAETLVRCREHKWDLEAKLQFSRNEVEKRWIELGIKMVCWQIKGLEVELQILKEKKELAQAQERTKALEVEAKKIEFEQRKHIAREVGRDLICISFGCLIVVGVMRYFPYNDALSSIKML